MAGSTPLFLGGLRISTADAPDGRAVEGSSGFVLAIVIFIVLAAIVVGSDLRSGELRIAISSIPNRGVLAAGQLVSLLAMVLSTSVIILGINAISGLWGGGTVASYSSPITLWIGFCTTAMTFTLLSAAVTLAVKNAIVAVSIIILIPLLGLDAIARVAPGVVGIMPYGAGQTVLQSDVVLGESYISTLLILIIWAAIAVVTFRLILGVRDV